MKSSLRNMLLSLTGLTVVAGLALGAVNYFTTEPIAKAREASRREAIAAVLPEFDNLEDIEYRSIKLYEASMNGNTIGIAVETYSDNGFSGRIDIMAGFDSEGALYGYRVLNHAETAGLGAKMGEWFQNDNVIGTTATIAVKADGGDVDAITGATITSRAFTDAINRAREAYDNYSHDSK